ncbi:MAG TPA: DUF6455 family protein [Burkholderiales bacterium]|nr:DUF6455 family protein [Burkholderiales bacterium]
MTVLLWLTFLAVIVLVGYGLANAWRHVLHDKAALPLHGMLRHQGLTLVEAGDEVGVEALAYAARRCTFCGSGADCRQRVAAGEPAPADCPNSGLLARLSRPVA